MSVRVLVIDDLPLARAELVEVLGELDGIEPVGAAAASTMLWPLLERTRPDVVLVGCERSPRDALVFCRRAKRPQKGQTPLLPQKGAGPLAACKASPARPQKGQTPLRPGVLAITATTDAAVVVPALLAGADGVLTSDADPGELAAAIRRVAAGERLVPQLAPGEIAGALGLDPERLTDDGRRMLLRVCQEAG